MGQSDSNQKVQHIWCRMDLQPGTLYHQRAYGHYGKLQMSVLDMIQVLILLSSWRSKHYFLEFRGHF